MKTDFFEATSWSTALSKLFGLSKSTLLVNHGKARERGPLVAASGPVCPTRVFSGLRNCSIFRPRRGTLTSIRFCRSLTRCIVSQDYGAAVGFSVLARREHEEAEERDTRAGRS